MDILPRRHDPQCRGADCRCTATERAHLTSIDRLFTTTGAARRKSTRWPSTTSTPRQPFCSRRPSTQPRLRARHRPRQAAQSPRSGATPPRHDASDDNDTTPGATPPPTATNPALATTPPSGPTHAVKPSTSTTSTPTRLARRRQGISEHRHSRWPGQGPRWRSALEAKYTRDEIKVRARARSWPTSLRSRRHPARFVQTDLVEAAAPSGERSGSRSPALGHPVSGRSS